VTRYEIQYDNVNNLISYIYDTSYLVNGDSPDRLVNGEFPDTNSTENTTNTLVKVPVEKIIETWNSID
jgi:hypothetical protein